MTPDSDPPAKALSVVLAGGGSAGHVSPLLAIARAVVELRPDARILAVGTADGLETRLVPAAGFELALIDRVPMPRRPSASAAKFPGRFRRAVRQAAAILDRANADVLVGVGGYVCTPFYLAARQRGIPIVIHEANTRAGLANRLGARFSSRVGTAFARTRIRHGQQVGMPMRREIAILDRFQARPGALAALGLEPELPTLLVTGGSLGAQRINAAVAASRAAFEGAGIQVLHITGQGKGISAPEGSAPNGRNYTQMEYVDGMENAYAAADLVLCRAGAGTVHELAAVGLPAVLVPLPVGNGEQTLNAAPLVEAHAALMVRDAELTPEWIAGVLLPLLQDKTRLSRMSANARGLGIRDADVRMARLVLEAVRQ